MPSLIADVGRELFDGTAKITRLLERDMLQRVDAEAVAVRQRNPVFVAPGEVCEEAERRKREIPQRQEVGALVFSMRIVEIARTKIPCSGPGVVVYLLKLGRPDATFSPFNGIDELTLFAEPISERIPLWSRLIARHPLSVRVDPVRAGMIEDDIENDAQTFGMGGGNQVDEIAAIADAWVYVEKVLDP